jgi:hypothetical protein
MQKEVGEKWRPWSEEPEGGITMFPRSELKQFWVSVLQIAEIYPGSGTFSRLKQSRLHG